MPRYDLKEKIGEGGMGSVYRAVQNPLGREVAIKVLRKEIAKDGDRLKRFQREVAACLKLAHPNIVKILDSGERDGQYYYVMELLTDGLPLDRMIAEQGPLSLRLASDVVVQVLEALEYCHGHQILHRDLKPANLMVRPGGLATLMDFGLAKDLEATTLLTQAGSSVGTPRYMAPEMFTPAEPTAAVDVWAAGCLFYEMLTAVPPFDGQSILEIATRISCGEYVPARTLRPDLPWDTDELIARFLEKDIARRIPSAAAGAEAIREWSTQISRAPAGPTAQVRPRPAGLVAPTDKLPRPKVETPRPEPEGPGSRAGARRTRRLAGVLLAAAGIGLAVGVALRPARTPVAAPAAPAFARTIGELAIQEGATSLEVTFESNVGAGLAVEAEARAESGSRKVRVQAEANSAAGRVALLTGLPPAAQVRVGVLGPDGAQLAARTCATRSLPEIATQLLSALDELKPYRSGQRMVDEIEKPLRLKDAAQREQRMSQVRRAWELKLRELMTRHRLEALVADVAPVIEPLMASASVPAEQRRRLYEHIYELRELEDIAELAKVPVPALAARLVTGAYGNRPRPTLVRPHVRVVQMGGEEPQMREILKPSEDFSIQRSPGEHLIIYSDLRRAAEAWMGTFGDGTISFTEPLEMPEPARMKAAEITVCVSRGNPTNGVRVMVASKRSKDRKDWRTIAVLKFRELERHSVSHPIPVELLHERPLFVRLELAYSPVRFVFQNVVEQECWLHWVAFGWTEVGASAAAH